MFSEAVAMEKSPRRGKVILGTVLGVTAVFGVFTRESLYWLATSRRVPHSVEIHGMRARGFKSVPRWGTEERHGVTRLWREDTGMLFVAEWFDHGVLLRRTYWGATGNIRWQARRRHAEALMERRTRSPWWWGLTDENEPSDPDWRGPTDDSVPEAIPSGGKK